MPISLRTLLLTLLRNKNNPMALPFALRPQSSRVPGVNTVAAPKLPFGPGASTDIQPADDYSEATDNPFGAQRLSAAGVSAFDAQAKQEQQFQRSEAYQQQAIQRQQSAAAKAAENAQKAAEKARKDALDREVTRAQLAESQAPSALTETQRAAAEEKAVRQEQELRRKAVSSKVATAQSDPAFNETTGGVFGMFGTPTEKAKSLQSIVNEPPKPEDLTESDLESYRQTNPADFSEYDRIKTTLAKDTEARTARESARIKLERAKAIRDGLSPEEADAILGASKPGNGDALASTQTSLALRKAAIDRQSSDLDALQSQHDELTARMSRGAPAAQLVAWQRQQQQLGADIAVKRATLEVEQQSHADELKGLEAKRQQQVEQSVKPAAPVVSIETAKKTAKPLSDGSYETSTADNLRALTDSGTKAYWSDPTRQTTAPTTEARAAKAKAANDAIASISATREKATKAVLDERTRIEDSMKRGDITPEQAQAKLDAVVEQNSQQFATEQAQAGKQLNNALRDFSEGLIDGTTLNSIFHAAGSEKSGIEAFQEVQAELKKEDEHVSALQNLIVANPDKNSVGAKALALSTKIAQDAQEYQGWLNAPESGGGEDSDSDTRAIEAEKRMSANMVELAALREKQRAELTAELTKRGVPAEDQASLIARAELNAAQQLRVGMGEKIEAKGGIAGYAATKLPFVGGIVDAANVLPYASTALKLQRGETATPEELEALSEFVRFSGRDSTWTSKVGETIAALPGFITELATTSGIATAAKEGGTKALASALQWAAKKEGREALAAQMAKSSASNVVGAWAKQSAKNKAALFAVKGATGLLGEAARLPVASAGRIAGKFVEDSALQGVTLDDQEGRIVAAIDKDQRHSDNLRALDAVVDSYIENVSERTGSLLAGAANKLIPSALKNGYRSLAEATRKKLLSAALVKSMVKLNPGVPAGSIAKFLKAAHFDSVPEEMGEERVGDLMRGAYSLATTGKSGLKVPTWEDLSAEAVSFLVPGGLAAVQTHRQFSKVNKALQSSDTEGSAHLASLLDDPDGTATRLSATTGQTVQPDEIKQARNLVGPIDQSDGVRRMDRAHEDILTKSEEALDAGDFEKAMALKQMALSHSRTRSAVGDQELVRALNAGREIQALHDQAEQAAVDAGAHPQGPEAGAAIAETARAQANHASALVKIARGRENALTADEQAAVAAFGSVDNGVIKQSAIDDLNKVAPTAASYIRDETSTREQMANAAAQPQVSPAQSQQAAQPVQNPETAAANGIPDAVGDALPRGASPNAGAPATEVAAGGEAQGAVPVAGTAPDASDVWTGIGTSGKTATIPASEAKTMSEAGKKLAVKLGEPLRSGGVTAPKQKKQAAKPATTTAQPTEKAKPAEDPKAAKAKEYVAKVQAATKASVERYRKAFAGVEMVKGDTRRAQFDPTTKKLRVNVRAIAQQMTDLAGDDAAMSEEIERLIRHEWIHSGTVAVRNGKQAAQFWRDLPEDMQKAAMRAYNAASEASGAKPADMSDAQKGYEAYRMFVELALDGKLTETTNIPKGLLGELRDFLTSLVDWMKRNLASLPKAKREAIDKDIADIEAALKALTPEAPIKTQSQEAPASTEGSYPSEAGATPAPATNSTPKNDKPAPVKKGDTPELSIVRLKNGRLVHVRTKELAMQDKPRLRIFDATGEPVKGDKGILNRSDIDVSPVGTQPSPEWVAFPSNLNSLNVPRASMPQIKSEHRGAMVQFLKGRGITHTQEDVPASSLTPSQIEYSPEKVEKAKAFTGPQRSILVSADNYVVDGHHQWMAALSESPDRSIPVIRLNAPIQQLLIEVARFPSSGVDEASESNVTPVEQAEKPKVGLKPDGISQEQWDGMATMSGPEQMAKYGTTRAKLAEQKMTAEKPSKAPRSPSAKASKAAPTAKQASESPADTRTPEEKAADEAMRAAAEGLFAADRPQPTPFYSKLVQVVAAKMPNRADVATIKGIIQNPQTGIKAEELKWSGIVPWLDGQTEAVTKQQVLDYLATDGAVRLEEVATVTNADPIRLAQDEQTLRRFLRGEGYTPAETDLITQRALDGDNIYIGGNSAIKDAIDNVIESSKNKDREEPLTKYAQYQLPGGENYREVVLAMPEVNGNEDQSSIAEKLAQGRYGKTHAELSIPQATSVWSDAGALVAKQNRAAKDANYTSSHFPDVPNYVAHMRLNDRTDADGRPGTFIEEIQSDRHQAGREKGYRDGEITALPEGFRTEQFPSGSWVVREPDDTFLGVHDTEDKAIQHTLRDLNTRKNQTTIPDAPFRTTWPLQMFKRALSDAVAAGKQWIGWTTGETQAERYDLSKQVGHITYRKVDFHNGARYGITVTYPEGGDMGIARDRLLTPTELSEMVGKEVAQKIINGEGVAVGTGDFKRLQGDNLKVGGEGMKGFYDNILPKEIGKYVKQWGAGVVKGSLLQGKTFEEWVAAVYGRDTAAEEWMRAKFKQNQTPIWRVDITPQMKSGVEGGQALFASDRPQPSAALEQVSPPADRFPAFIEAAKAIIAANVTTPYALAKRIDSAFPNGRGRKLSQAFWNAMTVINVDLPRVNREDWSTIYAAVDNTTPQHDISTDDAGNLVQRPGSSETGNADGTGGTRTEGGTDSGRVGSDESKTPETVGGGRDADSPLNDGAGRTDEGGGTSDSGRNDASERGGDSADVRNDEPPAVTNYVITAKDNLGSGTIEQKFSDNIAAIKLLKALESENRKPTRSEQAVLVRYVGWGGMKQVFNPDAKGWRERHATLKGILTDEEYADAARSQLDAHYTSETIIRHGIWGAMQRFGFTGGKMLEGGVGVGHMVGLMPADFRQSTSYLGVEKDSITSRIAAFLYPEARILGMGFEKANIEVNHFDGAVGNPPFGQQSLYDPQFKDISRFSIHNYFIAKHLEALRPGGVAAFVVSHYFLDALEPIARDHIASKAQFLGAIRLPNNAFQQNANTKVTTDIVFFARTEDGAENSKDWIQSNRKTDNGGNPYSLNSWIEAHPEMILGELTTDHGMHAIELMVKPRPGQNLTEELTSAVERLPSNVYRNAGEESAAFDAPELISVPDVPVGGFFVDENGGIRKRLRDVNMVRQSAPVELPEKTVERVKGMIDVRTAFNQLVAAELRDSPADELDQLREGLNTVYDGFVKKHGLLNQQANRRAFYADPQSARILGLETDFNPGVSKATAKKKGVDEIKPSARKADIFTKRVNAPYVEITKVDTAKEALTASLNQRGTVDMPYMESISGLDRNDILRELTGLVFENPNGGFEVKEKYLSGNVRQKLNEARAAQDDDEYSLANIQKNEGRGATNEEITASLRRVEARSKGERKDWSRNIEALEAVQPPDLLPSQVSVTPGAPFIPADVIGDFAEALTGERPHSALFIPANGAWHFSHSADNAAATQQWGTPRANFGDIFANILNNKPTVIYDTDENDRRVVATEATELARSKETAIKERWKAWVWEDMARAEKLLRLYNDIYNVYVDPHYDGSHLTLPGMSAVVNLRPHQKNVVWRIMNELVTLLDHVVGAGKTFAGIAGFMELRRTGRIRKPLFAVPNHLVTQWRDDFLKLYPNANVLFARPSDFQKDKRQLLFAKIMSGEYDAVIVGHSSLKKIGMSPEIETAMLNEMLDEISATLEALAEAEGRTGTRAQANLQRQKESIEAKLARLADTASSGGRDAVATFEELGIDGLFVDEAHEFKNLFYTTQMTRVAGLGNAAGSGKAFDLFLKTRYLRQRYNNRAPIVFATGTPISNSLVEMFTMQRYLQPQELQRMNITTLDAWARVYAQVEQVEEVDPTGTSYRVSTRLAKFQNAGDLAMNYRTFADVITMNDLFAQAEAQGKRFPIPKVRGGKPQGIVVPRTPEQAAYYGVETQRVSDTGEPILDGEGMPTFEYPQGTINWRVDNMPDDPREDNMLKLTNDARKAALDMRLIDPNHPDRPESKVNTTVKNILAIAKESEQDRGTQLVFCDLSIPSSARGKARAKAEAQLNEVFWIKLGDVLKIADKAEAVTIPGFESYGFLVYKNGREWNVHERSSGARAASGFTKSGAISAAQDQLQRLGERLPALIEQQKPDAEQLAAFLAEQEANKPEVEATDESDVAEEESADSVSVDELLAEQSSFSVYDDIKAKLIAAGMPENEVAFIHDFDSPEKKAQLFARMNRGDVRVLLGSTAKLGAGTNVQRKLVALHHMDAPWRPSDLEQREGRIIRQGNEFYERDPEGFEARVLRYATKLTYDTRMWQIIEHKAAGIEGFRKADRNTRVVDDISGEAANAADMKAASSGDPRIQREISLRGEITKLRNLQNAWNDNRHRVQSRLNYLKQAPERLDDEKKRWGRLIEIRDAGTTEKFSYTTPSGAVLDKKADILAPIVDILKSAKPREMVGIGRYRGFVVMGEKYTRHGTEYLSISVTPFGQSSARAMDIAIYNSSNEDDKISGVGLIQRLDNAFGAFESRIEMAEEQAKRDAAEHKDLAPTLNDTFNDANRLDELTKEHAALKSELMNSRRRVADDGQNEATPLSVSDRLGVSDDADFAAALDAIDESLPSDSELSDIAQRSGFSWGREYSDTELEQIVGNVRAGMRTKYDNQLDAQRHEEWVAAAWDIWNDEPRRKEGIKRLVEKSRNGEKITQPVEVKFAQIVQNHFSKQAIANRDPQAFRDAAALIWAYDVAGTETARGLAARYQPHLSPEERHREALAKVIFTPGAEERDDIKKAPTARSKAERIKFLEAEIERVRSEALSREQDTLRQVSQMTAELREARRQDARKAKAEAKRELDKLRAELERVKAQKDQLQMLNEANEKRMAQIEKAFNEMGVTFEELFVSKELSIGLRTSNVVKNALASFNEKERLALKMMMEGKSDRQIANHTGISRAKIPALEERFDAILDSKLEALVRRGFDIGDAESLKIDELIDKDGNILGSPNRPGAAALTDEEVKKRVQELRRIIKPKTEARNSGALKRFATNKGDPFRIDISDPAHVVMLMRAAQNVDSKGMDMVYEYWINALLSGPATHVANIAGNTGNTALEYLIQRPVEAIANAVLFQNAAGASLGEYQSMAKYAGRAAGVAWNYARTAWRTEVSLFDSQWLDQPLLVGGNSGDKGQLARFSIPGKTGRIIRTPSRFLQFADEWAKHFFGMIEAAAQAHRLAKADGLKPGTTEFDTRVAELVNVPGSPAWVAAVDKAHRLTFTEELPEPLKRAQDMIHAKAKTPWGAVIKTLLRFLFPFIKTPYNIFKTGLRKTPLGTARMIGKGIAAWRGKTPFFDSYPQAALAGDIAEQLLGWGAAMLIWAISEGDPDDDKKPVLITGTRSLNDDRGEDALLNRTRGGETTILVNGKPVFNYGRYEPFATIITSIVDAARDLKKIQGGMKPTKAMGEAVRNIIDQARNKTFLQGLDGLMQLIEGRSGSTAPEALSKFIVTGIIPNLIRQPIRNVDEYARDTKNAPWYYHAIPLGGLAEPLYDLYGRPVEKMGNPAIRALITVPTAQATVNPADTALRSWADKHPLEGEGDGFAYFPTNANRTMFRYKDALGKWQDMTPREIAELRKRGGANMNIEARSAVTNPRAPTQEDINRIKKVRDSAFGDAKKDLFPKGSRPVLPARPSPSLRQLFGLERR